MNGIVRNKIIKIIVEYNKWINVNLFLRFRKLPAQVEEMALRGPTDVPQVWFQRSS